jgi:ketosteroid isomerase-like protein
VPCRESQQEDNVKSFYLLVCIGMQSVVASASGVVPSNPANDVAVIKQISRDMGDAMVSGDIARLDEIFADDWVTIGSGKTITKESVLSGFKSGGDKLEAYELGPIDVQVFGNVAVAHGGVSEKRIRDGRDTSGEFVWMDLLEKRDGKWVVVKSAGDRVK